jgi:hypothetical protein
VGVEVDLVVLSKGTSIYDIFCFVPYKLSEHDNILFLFASSEKLEIDLLSERQML